MTRVKRGVIAHKKREKLLKYAKGFRWGRKSKERLAREALLHAWPHAFVGRKQRKRDFRRLWQTKINAAVRAQGLSYSKFFAGLHKKNIQLDRKILAELAEQHPPVFQKLLESIK
ncbi:MAG: 50S ribosomal protein L20 [Candidatus Sungiibacteriota bacterium]|uniref:Large ribosomal subunit protein bL20 n=1 Tax=Candidatus Sungiibacteriota bacterium TaxID=2750080 RepID=A0A7T5UQ92_9BACT|nr:MAG: 50S ribosomal protein L20 [Candidatus Sungbacteria bacterium]